MAANEHAIKYCEKVYERSGKNLCCIKNSGKVFVNLKLEI